MVAKDYDETYCVPTDDYTVFPSTASTSTTNFSNSRINVGGLKHLYRLRNPKHEDSSIINQYYFGDEIVVGEESATNDLDYQRQREESVEKREERYLTKQIVLEDGRIIAQSKPKRIYTNSCDLIDRDRSENDIRDEKDEGQPSVMMHYPSLDNNRGREEKVHTKNVNEVVLKTETTALAKELGYVSRKRIDKALKNKIPICEVIFQDKNRSVRQFEDDDRLARRTTYSNEDERQPATRLIRKSRHKVIDTEDIHDTINYLQNGQIVKDRVRTHQHEVIDDNESPEEDKSSEEEIERRLDSKIIPIQFEEHDSYKPPTISYKDRIRESAENNKRRAVQGTNSTRNQVGNPHVGKKHITDRWLEKHFGSESSRTSSTESSSNTERSIYLERDEGRLAAPPPPQNHHLRRSVSTGEVGTRYNRRRINIQNSNGNSYFNRYRGHTHHQDKRSSPSKIFRNQSVDHIHSDRRYTNDHDREVRFLSLENIDCDNRLSSSPQDQMNDTHMMTRCPQRYNGKHKQLYRSYSLICGDEEHVSTGEERGGYFHRPAEDLRVVRVTPGSNEYSRWKERGGIVDFDVKRNAIHHSVSNINYEPDAWNYKNDMGVDEVDGGLWGNFQYEKVPSPPPRKIYNTTSSQAKFEEFKTSAHNQNLTKDRPTFTSRIADEYNENISRRRDERKDTSNNMYQKSVYTNNSQQDNQYRRAASGKTWNLSQSRESRPHSISTVMEGETDKKQHLFTPIHNKLSAGRSSSSSMSKNVNDLVYDKTLRRFVSNHPQTGAMITKHNNANIKQSHNNNSTIMNHLAKKQQPLSSSSSVGSVVIKRSLQSNDGGHADLLLHPTPIISNGGRGKGDQRWSHYQRWGTHHHHDKEWTSRQQSTKGGRGVDRPSRGIIYNNNKNDDFIHNYENQIRHGGNSNTTRHHHQNGGAFHYENSKKRDDEVFGGYGAQHLHDATKNDVMTRRDNSSISTNFRGGRSNHHPIRHLQDDESKNFKSKVYRNISLDDHRNSKNLTQPSSAPPWRDKSDDLLLKDAKASSSPLPTTKDRRPQTYKTVIFVCGK